MSIGRYVQQTEGYKSFIPYPFPGENFSELSAEILQKSHTATLLIGKLDGITRLLPDIDFFLRMYIRKDATSSSQIEGTRATMIDAIEAESKTSQNIPDDVDDILHYIDAIHYWKENLKELPLSLRFICQIHEKIMHGARATHYSDPGNFRMTQNWIGGVSPSDASYIPPTVPEMKKALADLEIFMHTEDHLSPIIKAGIIHAQFEMIHPFLDGNGRTGRILIILYLWSQNLLDKPALFLSSYFKRYQKVYYQRLQEYHDGCVEKWLKFFLDGVISTTEESIRIVHTVVELRKKDMEKIQILSKTASESAVIVLHNLYSLPIVNVAKVMEWTGFSRPWSQKVIDRLVDIGILIEKSSESKYGKSYIYKEYIDIFLAYQEGN